MSILLKFPAGFDDLEAKPFINFKCEGRSGASDGPSIILPFITSFNQADQANYGAVELGALGFAAMGVGQAASAGGSTAEKMNQLRSAGQQMVAKAKSTAAQASGLSRAAFGGSGGAIDSLVGTALAGGAAVAAGSDNTMAKGFAIGQGKALNKYPVTEFTGMGIREYSFSYTLIPQTAAEAVTINSIIQAFRYNVYPSGKGIGLSYPPKWSIAFSKDIANKIDPIDQCFLKSFETSINDTANSWFYDSNPAEIKISLSFTETKAQTLETMTNGKKTGKFESGQALGL